MCSLWLTGVAILAGVGAGMASLIVGGVGARLTELKLLRTVTEDLDELHRRVDREVKRRAGEAGVAARNRDAEFLDALVKNPQRPLQPVPLADRSAVRARAREQGLM